jgi:hypothetical protein
MSDANLLNGISAIVDPQQIRAGVNMNNVVTQLISDKYVKVDPPQEKSFEDEVAECLKSMGLSEDKGGAPAPIPLLPTVNIEDESATEPPPRVYPKTPHPDRPIFSERRDDSIRGRTIEQRDRSVVTSLIGDSDIFSLEQEKSEDLKSIMLVEIDSLVESLSDAGISTKRIPEVGQQSSYADVEKVLKMLRCKNDHARCCTLASEFLLFGAYTMEELFDGKRDWWGHKPNLTGWHGNVQMRLHRVQPETGQIVSKIMENYEISPFMRIMIELIPNAFIYAKKMREQHGQPGLFNDDDMSDAAYAITNLKN